MHQDKQFSNDKDRPRSVPHSFRKTNRYLRPRIHRVTNGSLEAADNLAEALGKVRICSSFESLPNELLREIFGYIHDETERVSGQKLVEIGSATFHGLCLVSKQFYPVAREFLYRTVIVTDQQLLLLYRQLMRDEAAHSLIRNFVCVSDLTPDASVLCGSRAHAKLVKTSLTAVTGSRDSKDPATTANMQKIHKLHTELMGSMPCWDLLLGVTYILLHCMPRLEYLALPLPIPQRFERLHNVDWFWGRLWSRASFASLSRAERCMATAYIKTTASTVQTAPEVIPAKRKWNSDAYCLDNRLAAPAPRSSKILSNLRYLFLAHHWKTANVQLPVIDRTEYRLNCRLLGMPDASLRELLTSLRASVSDLCSIQALWLSTAQNTILKTLSVTTSKILHLSDPDTTFSIPEVPGGLTQMDTALSRWKHSLRTLHLDCMFSQPFRDIVYGSADGLAPPMLYSIATLSHLTVLTITTEAAFGDPWNMGDQLNQFVHPVDDPDAADAFLARLPASLEVLTVVEWWSAHVPHWPALEPTIDGQDQVNAVMEDFLDCVPHILGRTHRRLKQFTMVGLCAITWRTGEPLYGKHWIDSQCEEEYARCFHMIGVRFSLRVREIQLDANGNLMQEIGPNGSARED